MYKLIVKNKEVTIIDKTLSKDECESILGFGAEWVCNAFKKHVGIDIADYTIKEYQNGSDYFNLSIREEDLIKLREDKLSDLFK